MKVLLVDDSSVMRKIVLRTLRQAGFTGHDFDEAENGKDALSKIQAAKPDVVLSDWNMPEMTGIELLQQLNTNGIQTRFAFITSEATEPMKTAAIQAGAKAFLTKPFTPDTMRAALAGLLE
jgi:two-component system chemotaxis response regulator CheY